MMPSRAIRPLRILIALVLLLATAGWGAAAQPLEPPPPQSYRVTIRYRIRAGLAQRIAQFKDIVRYLATLGFDKDEGEENEAEDPDAVLMTGTIPAANARKILHERHVRAILLVPTGYDLPADADKPVKVQLELPTNLALGQQRLLAEQVLGLLQAEGFRESIGYDNRGHTRLVGTIPAGKLPRLLEDLRRQSSGWLVPQTPVRDLPAPLSRIWPVRVVAVRAGAAEAAAPPPEAAPPQGNLAKIAGDLLRLAPRDQMVRMEIILANAPQPGEEAWRRGLTAAAPGSYIEGLIGPVVTLRARADQAAALADLPAVVTVRLPRPATVAVLPALVDPADPAAALRAAGLDRLHAQGQRGRGVRVAVIGDNFRGYEQFRGKQLPAATRLVDLTAETSADLQPEPLPAGAAVLGAGTRCALAVARAAPEAELTLIRISPTAPYQLFEAARYIDGEPVASDSLLERRDELSNEADRLESRREQLLRERREILGGGGEDERTKQRRQQLKQEGKSLLDENGEDRAYREVRDAYFQRQAALDKQEQEHAARLQRYLDLVRELGNLRGIRVVVCTLGWEDGYPVDGSSTLSRFLEDGGFRSALWFQPAGDVRGQTWTGLFRDADGNGVMEFAPLDTPLKTGRWTPELSFLGWQPHGSAAVPDLPKGKVHVSVQWREPHDPTFRQRGEDLYAQPLADLRLLVLRQRDPAGVRLPSDDMEVVARSAGLPLRLYDRPGSAVYEQVVEFTVPAPGRYALRVEGRVAPGTRPLSVPTLPGALESWELRPRLFVSSLEESARQTGRPIFVDYATGLGSLGMPADAHGVVTVGAVDVTGRPRPYSAEGPPAGQALYRKPDVNSFNGLALVPGERQAAAGTALAASFAAGTAASALSAGIAPVRLLPSRQEPAKPGSCLCVPPPAGHVENVPHSTGRLP
jgi:hypothetical protein